MSPQGRNRHNFRSGRGLEGNLFDLDVADLIDIAFGSVRLAEADLQDKLALRVTGLDNVGNRLLLAFAQNLFIECSISRFRRSVIEDFVQTLVLLTFDIEADTVALAFLRREAGLDEKLDVPRIALLRRLFDPEGGGRCFYYSQFYGDYLFHSVICDKDGNVIDGRLGCAVSHGCVRLAKENATWIYDNIPSGTTVVVY